ncbi:chorismate synthase, partial [bacterium AH-315-C20]|nr:chorismate synthase [bacterium AH-315-C20]
NSFGEIFRLTTFGESHGKAIGGVIDGCPSNIQLDLEKIQAQLDRRRPGQSKISTERSESDTVEFLSGIIDDKTLGTPIGFTIKNKDHQSKDYDKLKDVYRPSHADYTYEKKYGIRDHRGGGRSSARETACRVVAGAIAQQILKQMGIRITAYVHSIGSISLSTSYHDLDLSKIENNMVRCPDEELAAKMEDLIKETKEAGDSLGGIIQCVVSGMPIGLGEPVFDRLNADLAKAMFSINTVKGFELGSGFKAASLKGSEHNDAFEKSGDTVTTKTNNSGGIQGGISNGEDIHFKVAFKPVATIARSQSTVSTSGEEVEIRAKGRHDPCVVPRAVPIVEAMCAITLLDHYLRNQTIRLSSH